ncbi:MULTISPECIES: DUF6440 family protein [Lactobacillus]|uniref:DUF6440 domain-containing protein n=1 Tax=Lactobacillus xujianguonis TaxID=2495899 RepID=A0A437ST00_9LACO|nr:MULTISPECIES: DUF6440 family protein [Lactobacillus]RVU70025.1 hypothetical protein EJK17_09830 [Lactobacillus xujianguonis]RVU73444.1 hypothetical protein EJK20_08150 [Lactobacillus xujianguonis]
MKIKHLAMIALASSALLLGGCSAQNAFEAKPHAAEKTTDPDAEFKDRLNLTFSANFNDISSRIITDPKTGIEYVEVYFDRGKAGGVSITPRLRHDGKPYINPRWKKK